MKLLRPAKVSWPGQAVTRRLKVNTPPWCADYLPSKHGWRWHQSSSGCSKWSRSCITTNIEHRSGSTSWRPDLWIENCYQSLGTTKQPPFSYLATFLTLSPNSSPSLFSGQMMPGVHCHELSISDASQLHLKHALLRSSKIAAPLILPRRKFGNDYSTTCSNFIRIGLFLKRVIVIFVIFN